MDKSKVKQAAEQLIVQNSAENWAAYVSVAHPAAILELLAELESARNAALEEAAKIAVSYVGCDGIVNRIRALATNASTEPASRGAAPGRITQDNGVGSSPADAGGLTAALDACLEIVATYTVRASEGKLNSIRRNRNNWKVEAASECCDAIRALLAAPSASASPAAPKQGCSWPVGNCQCAPLIQERDELRVEVDRLRASPAAAVAAPTHDSDCSLHNEPAYPAGPCDCSVTAPVAGSQQVPEAAQAILRRVANNGYACYLVKTSAEEIESALAAAAPAVPVPVEQDEAMQATGVDKAGNLTWAAPSLQQGKEGA